MSSKEKLMVDNVLTRKIAAMLATGNSLREIGSELGYSHEYVRRIASRSDTKEMVRDIGEAAITAAKMVIKNRVAHLAKKIIEVVEKKLDEGDLDAVKVGLKILGFSELESRESMGSTNLTVIMPGKQEPTPIEAEVINLPEATNAEN